MNFGRQAAARTPDGLILSPLCTAGVLVCADDGGVDDQVFKVRIICHRFEHVQPDPFRALPAEAPEHAVPFAERFGQIAPRRTGAHDPQNAFDEHAVVAARRTALVRPTDDQTGDTIPLRIAQNKPLDDAPDFLLKESLESQSDQSEKPKSPHDLVATFVCKRASAALVS
jgi:hypothetical protein